MNYNLKISEYSSIAEALLYKGFDFNNYASSFFHKRIEESMIKFETFDTSNLIKRLENDIFISDFVHFLRPSVTEFFRDPTMWLAVANEIVPKLLKKEDVNVYFPQCSSGEELYSFLIILEQLNAIEKVNVFADEISEKHIEFIKTGIYPHRKIEAGEKNYDILGYQTPLSHYIPPEESKTPIKKSLLSNTKFNSTGWFDIDTQKKFDIIFFRNNMIYYNSDLQRTVVNLLYEMLEKNGYLIIGTMENLPAYPEIKLSFFNKHEKIYKKQTGIWTR